MSLLKLIRHPFVDQVTDINSPTTYKIHRSIILSKPFMLAVYRKFYSYLFDALGDLRDKKIVEIGAGGFNANYFTDSIITTDLSMTEFTKEVQDAQCLSYKDNEIDGLIFIDVLHHIPKPKLFFSEALRCLKKSGKIVFIEPYYSPWGSLVYKNLHHEPWSDTEDWDIPKTTGGRLSDANMKMPYNIFVRDLEKFKDLYPELEVTSIKKINFFYYLASGGLSYRSLLPGFMAPVVFFIEWLLSPLKHLLAMHMVVEITKK